MKKRYIIIPLIVIILIVTIVLLVPKSTKETYAVGDTLAETVKALNAGSSWTSGASGVYYTNSHEYRYVGKEVNNYVSFNGDMYRIIGVFDDYTHGVEGEELVKLIRSRILGSYSWGNYNSTATSGTHSNCDNDWTGNKTIASTTDSTPPANLNLLLNEYYFNKTNTSNTYGACSNWTYYYNNTNCRTNDCSDIVGYGISSEVRDYIQSATWHLMGYIGNGYSKQNFYLCERGQSTDTTNCMSGNSGTYDASTEDEIGLMYVSDYMYASGYFASDDTTTGSSNYYGNQNWLYKGHEWTITPDADSADSAFYVARNGVVVSLYVHYGDGARPTFYLKSSVYVTGGNGSFSNPYTISCDDCSS